MRLVSGVIGVSALLGGYAEGGQVALASLPGLSAQSVSSVRSEPESPDGVGHHIAHLNEVGGLLSIGDLLGPS
jgi:hypothetical protein